MVVTQKQAEPATTFGVAPRKLAILESSARMGGIQHTTLALITHLDRSCWTPVLICPEEGELTRACRAAEIEVHVERVLPLLSTSLWVSKSTKIPNPLAWMWNGLSIWLSAKRTEYLFKRLQPSLVVTKGLLCHFYGGLGARNAGIPCVWYVQDWISQRFGGIYTVVFDRLARWLPARIGVIGPQIARLLSFGVQRRTHVIYNAIDTQRFRPIRRSPSIREELGIPVDALVIGNAARLTPWKGQHHLIEAFHQVAHKIPEAHLLLVGGDLFGEHSYQGNLKRRIKKLGLTERVTFAGHRADMNAVFSAMDVFAYCSVEKDICPLSLLEAMSAGLPVAAFNFEGIREAITDSLQGLLVPSKDEKALAISLERLLSNPELRHSLGDAARRNVERRFSIGQHVMQMQDLFEKTVKDARIHL